MGYHLSLGTKLCHGTPLIPEDLKNPTGLENYSGTLPIPRKPPIFYGNSPIPRNPIYSFETPTTPLFFVD